MTNRGLLIIIAVLVAGVLGILFVQYQNDIHKPELKIADSTNNKFEEIGSKMAQDEQ